MIKSVSYIIFAFTLCLAFTGIAHANPCRTADGYLDKGIGGTGLIRGGDDDDGIGGTGLRDNGVMTMMVSGEQALKSPKEN